MNDIKEGKLKSAYLLYGEEVYLKLQYRDNLLKAMVTDGDTMNYTRFEGKDMDAAQIISIADTMPFFADYRTILVMNSGFFKNGNDMLCDYLKQPSQSTRFIFVEREVDKRSRMFKTVKNLGNAVEFLTQDEATLRKWIASLVAKEGKNMDGGTIAFFMDKTGSDMSNIKMELEKVFCYTLKKDVITKADIDAVVTVRIGNHIFDMINAIASRQQEKALNLYYGLLAQKEPPMKILSLITRQFNLLLQAKELKNKGYDRNGIATKLQLQPFISDKYVQQSVKFKMETLRSALKDCLEADESIKLGRMTDRMCVELLIVRYSAGAKA